MDWSCKDYSHSLEWCHKGMRTLDGNNNCTCIIPFKCTTLKIGYLGAPRLIFFTQHHAPPLDKIKSKQQKLKPTLPYTWFVFLFPPLNQSGFLKNWFPTQLLQSFTANPLRADQAGVCCRAWKLLYKEKGQKRWHIAAVISSLLKYLF